MGRYFKTSSPQQLDFMYKLPEELMLKATQQVSNEITQLQADGLSLHDKVPINALDVDKVKAKALVDATTKRIDDIVSQVHVDPLNFRKKAGEITALARDIHKEWTTGEAAAYNNRYAAAQAYKKQMDELLKAGRIKDAEHAQLMVKWNMANQKAAEYDPTTGKYNEFSEEFLTPDIDHREKYNKIAKEMEAKIRATSGASTDGMYITSSGRKVEIKSEEDIQNVLLQEFMADDDFHKYLRQRTKIGALQVGDYVDSEGQILSPYGVIGKDKNGKEVYGWKNNKLGLMFSGITDANVKDNVLESHSGKSADGNYGYGVEALKRTAAAPPNTKNTTISIQAAPKTIDQLLYKQTDKVYTEGAAVVVKAIQNLPSSKAAVALKELKDAELAFAQNGGTDISPLAAVYQKYVPQALRDGRVERGFTEYGYNRAIESANANYYNAITAKVQKAFPNFTYTQVQNKVGELLNNTDLTNVNANLFATSGNSEELWTNPVLRGLVVRNAESISKLAAEPTSWGSSFHYVSQQLDDKGEPLFKDGEPVMITREANNATLGADGSISFQTINDNKAEMTKEQVTFTQTDTGRDKGKLTNTVGQPQFIPMNFTYNYKSFETDANGTPLVKPAEAFKDSWLIRVPISSSDRKGTSYVLIRGDQITNDEFDQLKREANYAASSYSVNLQNELLNKSLGKIDRELKK